MSLSDKHLAQTSKAFEPEANYRLRLKPLRVTGNGGGFAWRQTHLPHISDWADPVMYH